MFGTAWLPWQQETNKQYMNIHGAKNLGCKNVKFPTQNKNNFGNDYRPLGMNTGGNAERKVTCRTSFWRKQP